ncbi:MAG: SDR family oxidoreductase, partial [Janthinobacterium lividum]
MSKISRAPRSVVVSGASTGIGRATAERLAAQGWHVLAGVRRLVDAPQPLAGSPGSIRPVVLDVTDAASVGHAREQVVEVLQGAPLAALINNAG